MSEQGRGGGRVFVIGGSAGSIEALRELFSELPEEFPAPILTVVHTSVDSPGNMPQVLSRRSHMPIFNAVDGAPLKNGYIYVAPPGFHLLVEDHRMRLLGGPTENRHRPAIDPLFRSAAQVYGPGAVGIVLSGYLDDGSAGVFRIKEAGGTVVIQDPEDAIVGDMPRNAAERVQPDYSVPIRELAPLMVQLAGEPVSAPTVVSMSENEFAKQESSGSPAVFTCPECHGTLWEEEEGGTLRFRCRVGHAYTADSMLEEQNLDVERALWAALRTLEENTELSHRLADRAHGHGFVNSERRYRERARESYTNAKVLRRLLTGAAQVPAPARAIQRPDEEMSAD